MRPIIISLHRTIAETPKVIKNQNSKSTQSIRNAWHNTEQHRSVDTNESDIKEWIMLVWILTENKRSLAINSLRSPEIMHHLITCARYGIRDIQRSYTHVYVRWTLLWDLGGPWYYRTQLGCMRNQPTWKTLKREIYYVSVTTCPLNICNTIFMVTIY